ncbi:hypothetical protein ACVIYL_003627 [Bradyrhizobium sp. USDA 3315]
MHSVVKIYLLIGLAFASLTAPARADYCHDWLATLSRAVDMSSDMNVGTASGLHVAMHTQAKAYEEIAMRAFSIWTVSKLVSVFRFALGSRRLSHERARSAFTVEACAYTNSSPEWTRL